MLMPIKFSNDESAANFIALKFLGSAFITLAAGFASVDAASAEETVQIIEQGMAERLFALRNEHADRFGDVGVDDHLLHRAALILRDTIVQARHHMAKAARQQS
jgi:hypothetical protein